MPHFFCSFRYVHNVPTMNISVTVRSCLPLGDPQGDFSQSVEEDMTVGSFIRKVCRDAGISMRSSLVLKNSSNQELRWSASLREAYVMSGATLMLYDTGKIRDQISMDWKIRLKSKANLGKYFPNAQYNSLIQREFSAIYSETRLVRTRM